MICRVTQSSAKLGTRSPCRCGSRAPPCRGRSGLPGSGLPSRRRRGSTSSPSAGRSPCSGASARRAPLVAVAGPHDELEILELSLSFCGVWMRLSGSSGHGFPLAEDAASSTSLTLRLRIKIARSQTFTRPCDLSLLNRTLGLGAASQGVFASLRRRDRRLRWRLARRAGRLEVCQEGPRAPLLHLLPGGAAHGRVGGDEADALAPAVLGGQPLEQRVGVLRVAHLERAEARPRRRRRRRARRARRWSATKLASGSTSSRGSSNGPACRRL